MADPAEPPPPVERRLVFSLASGAYGLRLEAISGVAELTGWRPVPGLLRECWGSPNGAAGR